MICWLALVAPAADTLPPDTSDWIGPTLRQQLQRHTEQLSLPEAPPLYHLRYQLMQLGQVDASASMGSLVWRSADALGTLGVEVRVGTPQVDNTGFGGWQDGFASAALPQQLTPTALAHSAWRLTDAAYKEAVEQRARKLAQWTPPDDHPGDYSLIGPVTADLGAAHPQRDPEPLSELVVRLSGALATDPPLLRGELYVGHEAGELRIVDSEGTDVRIPVEETTIRAVAALRAPDGALLTDQRLWTVRSADALPPEAELQAEVVALREELQAAARSEPLQEEYVGPVLFEGEAARALFRYVLVPQLEGTPPQIPFDSFFGDLGDDRDPVRLGRRVLPPGWDALDDPGAHLDHPAGARHDYEGTPTQPVHLIDDGIVRDLAMSRVPRRGLDGTNGHARSRLGSRQEGRVSVLQIRAARQRSSARLRRQALKLARDYGRDYVLVVRRLQEPAILRLVDGTWFDDDLAGTALPPPVSLIRLYADGRQEAVRGASFASIQRWILRDIVAAGPSSEGSYLAPLGTSYAALAPTQGIASWLSAPDVLVGEAELVPVAGDPRDVPTVPPPTP